MILIKEFEVFKCDNDTIAVSCVTSYYDVSLIPVSWQTIYLMIWTEALCIMYYEIKIWIHVCVKKKLLSVVFIKKKLFEIINLFWNCNKFFLYNYHKIIFQNAWVKIIFTSFCCGIVVIHKYKYKKHVQEKNCNEKLLFKRKNVAYSI